ncbi:MAG TPA: dicarboxylate/amino acid:cation symporter [Bacteroidia bacterium]|jgi:Na+/H+-dicarboxylate symporter|nr:dicarboxylate/amino acid:cation symporter [Bacteroidia bacterium]
MKKPGLIFWIFLAVFSGLLVGFFVNKAQTDVVPSGEAARIVAMANGDQRVEEGLRKQASAFRKSEVNYFKNKAASRFSWLSDLFLRLIKMIIAPLVFSVLVVGVAKVGDFGSVGRIGLKTLLYFTCATLMALSLGLFVVNVFKPGETMNITLPEVSAQAARESAGVKAAPNDAKSIISHIVPESIIGSMASNEILPIVVFAIFFGVAVAATGKQGEIVVHFFEALTAVMFKITNYVMKFAPLGVFGAITAVVITQGLEVLQGYAWLIVYFFSALLFFVFVILGGICYMLKIPFLRLMRMMREPLILAFSTASSESAMPKAIEGLEKFGCSERVVSFVLPLGYSFNLDGSIVYMTFATVFIAQAYHIQMSIPEQIQMLLILLVTSKGMAGVPRASLVVIAGMLEMFHIPGQGLLLLLGVDQLLDMGRSATNVAGNAVAAAVVSKWENELTLETVPGFD